MNNERYLVMVDPVSNHNKFYHMVQLGAGMWEARYGRVGATPQKRRYNMRVWQDKYQEKLEKGYIDQTIMHTETKAQVSSDYADISDSQVQDLVDRLLAYSNTVIQSNYRVTAKEITPHMIEEAKRVVARLYSETTSTHCFNQLLLELYRILPRKMQNVQDYLAKNTEDFSKIILREEDLLDIMAGSLTISNDNSKENEQNGMKTILEAANLEIRQCDDQEIAQIKKFLGAESTDKFKRAFYVKNKKTEDAFNEYCHKHKIGRKDIHLWYHGSRNENYWSILSTGLKLKPNAKITGKMFGYGIYFAPRAKKSIGYTSLSGSYWAGGKSDTAYLAVFKTAYKKPMDVHSHKPEYANYTESSIKKQGYDAMFAHAGSMLRNDEVIVYNEAQCTIRYLIELKN